MTSHPSLSPEERVSLSDPLEDSMIAGFVAVAAGSSGTLMVDASANPPLRGVRLGPE